MADLLLKVGDASPADDAWKDGDVIGAFNDDRIGCAHAQQICHVKTARRNASGLILPSEVARNWFETTHQYRFERVSARELKRVTIATGDEEILSDVPNAKGEHIDVRLFVRRRKDSPGHSLFGEDGAEIWYGGRQAYTAATIAAVWAEIENKTPHRRAQFSRWPMGRLDIRSHLPIRVDDFDEATRVELESAVLDEADNIVTRRRNQVQWRIRLGLTPQQVQQVEDRGQVFDDRERRQHVRAVVVRRKPDIPDIPIGGRP